MHAFEVASVITEVEVVREVTKAGERLDDLVVHDVPALSKGTGQDQSYIENERRS